MKLKAKPRKLSADANVPPLNCRPVCRKLTKAFWRLRDTARVRVLVWLMPAIAYEGLAANSVGNCGTPPEELVISLVSGPR
jgi:hypothetical protein